MKRSVIAANARPLSVRNVEIGTRILPRHSATRSTSAPTTAGKIN